MKRFLFPTFLLFLVITVSSVVFWFYRETGLKQKSKIATLYQTSNKAGVTPKSNALNQEVIVNLKEKEQVILITIKSYVTGNFEGKTDIFVNSDSTTLTSLYGLLQNSYAVDIENNGDEELVVDVVSGKLGNTTIYRYQNNQLIPVSTHTGKQENLSGVTSYHFSRFKDINSDKVLEMISYHTAFPFDKIGWLEVYKFNGLKFMKIDEYEETTQDFYL